MSQDNAQRTHKPTPKRIREFRKRGEIALSKDVTSIAVLLGGTVGCVAFSHIWTGAVGEFTREAIQNIGTDDVSAALWASVRTFAVCILPVALGALAGFVIATGVQLGWPPAFKKPSFNLGKPLSLKGLPQILSPKAAAGRALKATAKVALVAVAMVLAMHMEFDRFLSSPALEATGLGVRLGEGATRLATYGIAVLAVLGVIDFVVQKRGILAKMKMTPEEIKREHKEQEGDPLVRGQRKRRMRELAQRRLKRTVQTADVVIVNPTHYAVAIRYEQGADHAPKVVAKGKGPVAEKIREFARSFGVPVLSRPPLTRLIYRTVKEGREIPADLYKAIAEILAYVYRVRGRIR